MAKHAFVFDLLNVEWGMKLEHCLLIDLVTRFPNVEDIACHTWTDKWTPSYKDGPDLLYPWEYEGLRRDTRHEFKESMANFTIFLTMTRVNLDFLCHRSIREADCIHH